MASRASEIFQGLFKVSSTIAAGGLRSTSIKAWGFVLLPTTRQDYDVGHLKRQRTIWLVMALIAVIGMAGWFMMPVKEEARYEGKTLKEWFEAIDLRIQPVYNGNNPPLSSDPAFHALKVLKKEVSPFLLREVKESRSTIHNLAYFVLNRLSFGHIMSDVDRRRRIWNCFEQLGPDLTEAVPDLVGMTMDPGMVNRSSAVAYLGAIHSQPKRSIPVIENLLKSGDTLTLAMSIWALGRLGAEARSATPSLISIWQTTTNINLQATIVYSLHNIDPEAAAKAGIK